MNVHPVDHSLPRLVRGYLILVDRLAESGLSCGIAIGAGGPRNRRATSPPPASSHRWISEHRGWWLPGERAGWPQASCARSECACRHPGSSGPARAPRRDMRATNEGKDRSSRTMASYPKSTPRNGGYEACCGSAEGKRRLGGDEAAEGSDCVRLLVRPQLTFMGW